MTTMRAGRSMSAVRGAVLAACATAGALLMVVELPMAAEAANTTYYNATSHQGAWHSSPLLSSTGNQAYTQFGGANVTVDNGTFSSTSQSGATQTYSRRTVYLSCRFYISNFPDSTAPLNCVLIS
ncbi:hypothetical protein [Leifsonia sp. PS1209]|uniref:hypothetical protein n=1 Tax=Leifsonia sp. PS1209 TaxID=2724914 RepID=UPI001442CB8C|nr:hypothetical protein [Leifsonia sp. PS1209]QJA00354.1 hypothetical protein HF024_18835 [Leifsonia sp. PS1209]